MTQEECAGGEWSRKSVTGEAEAGDGVSKGVSGTQECPREP